MGNNSVFRAAISIAKRQNAIPLDKIKEAEKQSCFYGRSLEYPFPLTDKCYRLQSRDVIFGEIPIQEIEYEIYRQNVYNTRLNPEIKTLDQFQNLDGRSQIFFRRLKDTGWGWSLLGGCIPFVSLYYAISRGTITPILYKLITLFISINIFNLTGVLNYLHYTIIAIIILPLANHAGISRSRKFAMEELINHECIRTRNISSWQKFIFRCISKLRNPFDPINKTELKLKKIKSMYKRGIISKEEYQSIRKKTLGI